MLVWNLIGRVTGRRIELDSDPGLPPGTTVTVKLEPQAPSGTRSVDRIMATCGAWKDDEQIHKVFGEIAKGREARTCRDVDFDVSS